MEKKLEKQHIYGKIRVEKSYGCISRILPEAFIFCDGNLEQKGQCVYYPVYMLMCLEKPAKKELIYQLNLSELDN